MNWEFNFADESLVGIPESKVYLYRIFEVSKNNQIMNLKSFKILKY